MAARHEGEILTEFTALLALPNLASDSANIERNAEAIRAMLERRGISARLLRVPGAPPLVIGDVAARARRAHPRVLRALRRPARRHRELERIAVDPGAARPGGARHRARGRSHARSRPEARIWARSAGDDKAPIIAMLAALDAMREKKRAPEFALRLVFEGEEEAGSPHLATYLERVPECCVPTPGSCATARCTRAGAQSWRSAHAASPASRSRSTARSRACTTATTATGCPIPPRGSRA
jgi:hypothetical protein